MTGKWIVDDAGTLINMVTRNHYDYVEEVVDVLNKLSEENEKLKEELESFEQVNFTDMCDGSRTVLYMKKENVGDV